MLEDPRTQRMKQMKIELLKNFVTCILIALVIYFVSVGLPLFGMPKLDDVVSAQATYDGQTVEIAQEDMQIAVDLAGGAGTSGRERWRRGSPAPTLPIRWPTAARWWSAPTRRRCIETAHVTRSKGITAGCLRRW